MANYWNIAGVPHRGWTLEDVIDVRGDGQAEWETDYESCMMCGNERIRYVHIVSHPDVDGDFRVGCVCAEKMTNDYVNPERLERQLRNRASRRANWLNRDWRYSKNGNHYLKIDGKFITIFRDKRTGKYKVSVDGTFGKKSFEQITEAKIAAFKGIEYLKDKGRW
ncbi:MAG TPA: hypothetical protein VHA52_09205 [Candidatus Babeliaceae bacterium]|nr:hypothetical protein [Candidatus Babeliaceae bacterium]